MLVTTAAQLRRAVAAVFLLSSAAACSAFVINNPAGEGSSRVRSSSLSMSAALIVQNKGGGHGELGYQLAKNLQTNPKITSVTILQDDACKDDQEPFSLYSKDLPGVSIIKAPLGDDRMTADEMQKFLASQKFDYIWDNCSKGASGGSGKAIIDLAQTWQSKLLTYVSSAGMYQPDATTQFPMDEATTPIKSSAGQAQYDAYARSLNLPYVSFRPQYIYGPHSNKYDYMDWYFDRIVRQQPLPIPGDGTQLVSLTNSEDVASLLASVLNNEAAAMQQCYFNCGTDQLVSYNDVANMCAKAANINNVNICHYDAALGKAKFPFRLTNFYVAPSKAKQLLGWTGPKHSLSEDLDWYYQNYLARGGVSKQVDLSADQELLVAAAGASA